MIWHGTEGPIEWAAAGKPLRGEVVSGDCHAILPFAGGIHVALIDGLGHGMQAEKAAHAAVEAMQRQPSRSAHELVLECHKALSRLRGAVMSVASFSAAASTMTWLGVGNVEGVLVSPRAGTRGLRHERLLLRGGVVGQSLPTLRPATLPVAVGDVLVMATDGLRSSFVDDLTIAGAATDIAARTLERHATNADDAHVLVARYAGLEP